MIQNKKLFIVAIIITICWVLFELSWLIPLLLHKLKFNPWYLFATILLCLINITTYWFALKHTRILSIIFKIYLFFSLMLFLVFVLYIVGVIPE